MPSVAGGGGSCGGGGGGGGSGSGSGGSRGDGGGGRGVGGSFVSFRLRNAMAEASARLSRLSSGGSRGRSGDGGGRNKSPPPPSPPVPVLPNPPGRRPPPPVVFLGGATPRAASPAVMAALLAAVPARFTASALRLAYSTAVHGVSVATFYARTRGAVPALLVARDGAGGVFGAYTTAEWRVAPRYVGRGEAFVFRVAHPRRDTPAEPPTDATASAVTTPGEQQAGGDGSDQARLAGVSSVAGAAGAAAGAAPSPTANGEVHPAGVIVYRWTRKNPYFQLGAERHLAVGGGGGFALWFDDEFRGTTAASDTFGSPVLCVEGGGEGKGAAATLPPADSGAGRSVLDPPREERHFECVVFEAWALETAVSTLRRA
ncbi:hypothetical protein MMPV_002038 [Pyropia vietnamensis]